MGYGPGLVSAGMHRSGKRLKGKIREGKGTTGGKYRGERPDTMLVSIVTSALQFQFRCRISPMVNITRAISRSRYEHQKIADQGRVCPQRRSKETTISLRKASSDKMISEAFLFPARSALGESPIRDRRSRRLPHYTIVCHLSS